MTRPSEEDRLRVMPWWLVLLGLAAAALLGGLVITWLLGEADAGDTRAALRIDAIRTGLTVVAGTGGAVALLLAGRRQWVNERAQRHRESVDARQRDHLERVQSHAEAVASTSQRHQERQALAAEHDATERRLTELYTRAVDLLGNDRAAVRMAGLYALERLAQDHDRQRQTMVDVLCAYLRMPDPDESPQEAQVRLTAQRLLARHLRPADESAFWPGIRLDLAGARLADFDLSGCDVADADLTRAVLLGAASLAGTVVRSGLRLAGAAFEAVDLDDLRCLGEARLGGAVFNGPASLRGAEFAEEFSLDGTRFADRVSFSGATFRGPARFDSVAFGAGASFDDAVFERGFSLEHAVFSAEARFRRTRFGDMALLRWTDFQGDVSFERANFAGVVNLARVTFHRDVQFDGAVLRRGPQLDQTRAAVAAAHSWPAGCRPVPLDDRWLLVEP
jgi:uncharacterized protein YjbI with pentapeptide repeats